MSSTHGIITDRLSPRSPQYFDSLRAYGQSKLCLIMFISQFRRTYPRMDEFILKRFYDLFVVELYFVACHPGNAINSNLTRNSLLYWFLVTIARPFSKSLVKRTRHDKT